VARASSASSLLPTLVAFSASSTDVHASTAYRFERSCWSEGGGDDEEIDLSRKRPVPCVTHRVL
jgi:hypothetical protein